MVRRLFGRQDRGGLAEPADWPQLSDEPLSLHLQVPSADLPALPSVPSGSVHEATSAVPSGPEVELLEQLAAFRGEVSDSFCGISKDYRMLCELTRADLTECDAIVAELRKRLSGNAHYEVLAKLDEVLAMVASRIGPV